jgi:two-component system chemotaxis response regulator CheY
MTQDNQEPRRLHPLVVEDSPPMRKMFVFALSRIRGLTVAEADDGVDALRRLASTKFDLIITDINMPRLDGFGFIEGVRRNEKYRAIPILVLTTESDAEKKNRARQAGATGWIVKPFDPAKLIDAIERVTA